MIPKYEKRLKQYARQQRSCSTKGEILLWMGLRSKALGVGFKRQKPIGHYIADFYCSEIQLVIEVDGLSHTFEEVQQRDAQKDAYFASLGIEVMRIEDAGIFVDLAAVLEEIKAKVDERKKATRQTKANDSIE